MGSRPVALPAVVVASLRVLDVNPRALELGAGPVTNGTPDPPGAVSVAIWRKGFAVHTQRIDPFERRAFDIIRAGETIAGLCAALQQSLQELAVERTARALSAWLTREWIVEFTYQSRTAGR